MHITPWYPDELNPGNALFIKRHVDAFGGIGENTVLHMDVNMSDRRRSVNDSVGVIRVSAGIKWKIWRYYEWRYCQLLISELKRIRAREEFSHAVFHIAYPSLVFFNRLKQYLPDKCLIVEHWSAYHFNFQSVKKLERIALIFKHGLPLVVVSDELGRSIRRFCGTSIHYVVVPNVVDEQFYFEPNTIQSQTYFMAAWWKSPKKPLEMIEAMHSLRQKGKEFKLRIAGDGPLLDSMKQTVHNFGLEDAVEFIGVLNPQQLRTEFNSAKYFLMPSGYETFSVGCAEALACGCPVLADRVGALHEIVREGEGRLVDTGEIWEEVLKEADAMEFDRENIAALNAGRFSKQVVANAFRNVLDSM